MTWFHRTKSKHFIQVWDGLLDPEHIENMGVAVWFYLWCLYRQTSPEGWVLDGRPISWIDIVQDLGKPERTVRRWCATCRNHGYIEVTSSLSGVRIRITKAKKMVAISGQGGT